MSKFKIQPVAVQSHRLFNPIPSVAELTPGYVSSAPPGPFGLQIPALRRLSALLCRVGPPR